MCSDPPRQRPALELSLVALGALLLAVVVSWPLLPQAWSLYPSDPLMPDLNVAFWLPGHLIHEASLTSPMWAPGLHWPVGQDNGTLLWNLGIQIMQVPFYLLFDAVPALNLSLIFMAALNGLGAWVLARVLGFGRAGAAAAAALLVANPYAWGELVQGRGEQGLLFFLALTVAGFVRIGRAPGRRVAVATGVAWALAGLCYWFYAYFALLVALPVAVGLAVRRRWLPLAMLGVAGGVAALIVAPFAAQLLLAAAGDGSVFLQAREVPIVAETSTSSWASLTLASFAGPFARQEQLRDFLPITASLALLCSVLLWRRAAWVPLMGLVAVVLSFGAVLNLNDEQVLMLGGNRFLTMPYAAVQEILPGFWRMIWPYRFLSLAVLASAGGAAALVAMAGRLRWLAMGVLSVVAVAELRVVQHACGDRLIWTQPDPLVVPELFRELAGEPGASPLLILPFRAPVSAMRWAPYHRQPVTEGNGDMDDHLMDPAWIEHVGAHPALAAVQRLGRDPHAQPVAHPSALDELAELGLGWAVLQLDTGPQGVPSHTILFGRPPDYEDDVVAAWRLGAAEGLAPEGDDPL